jgi:ATP-dependent Clp protease adaptor protein ClpS
MSVKTGLPSGATVTRPQEEARSLLRRQPPYNVILLDDDDHTYEYVIRMLKQLFGHPEERGYDLARQVDTSGRAIVLTTTLEHAELKRDQIHAYGRDVLLSRSRGSMSAAIEPVDG